MNLFKKQPKTRGYKTIPDALAEDDTAAVPFGTTLLPSTTTTMTTRRMAMVAGVLLLVVLAGGGAVVLLAETTTDGGRPSAAEGLVVAKWTEPPVVMRILTYPPLNIRTVPPTTPHSAEVVIGGGPSMTTACEITCEANCEDVNGCRSYNVNCFTRCRESCKGAKSPNCHGGLS